MTLPTYKMIVDIDDDELGVDVISVVADPAIGVSYQRFKNQNLKFKIANEEKQILTGAIMVADMPIYRNNAEVGEHYVVFDSENIETIAQKFFKNGYHLNVNLNHEPEATIKNVYFYESWIINRERGKLPPKGYEDISDGSWFGTLKIEDPDIWNLVKSDDFTGFSVEGVFKYSAVPTKLSKNERRLLSYLNDLVKNHPL